MKFNIQIEETDVDLSEAMCKTWTNILKYNKIKFLCTAFLEVNRINKVSPYVWKNIHEEITNEKKRHKLKLIPLRKQIKLNFLKRKING